MKVVLFIGHHKVGSTALQQFMSRNWLQLARAGILYPMVESQGMAMMMGQALAGREETGGLPFNVREAHNALAFKMLAEHNTGKVPPFHEGLPHSRQMFRNITQQVNYLKPRAVVLVAEVFSNFAPSSTRLIEALVRVFPEADFTIVATLRRIDDYLASWHAQRLRFGHRLQALSAGGAAGYFNTIHFDYRKILQGWQQVLPEADFALRDYADVLATGGSVEDFRIQTGLDFPAGLHPAEKANLSMHRGVVDIARHGFFALPGKPAQTLRQYLTDVGGDLGLPKSSDVEMFGAQVRAQIAERFEPVQGYLGRLSGRNPFFADQDSVARLRPCPEAEVAAQALAQLRKRRDLPDAPGIAEFLRDLDLTRPPVAAGTGPQQKVNG